MQTLVLCGVVLWRLPAASAGLVRPDRQVALRHLLAATLLAGNWVVYVYSVATDRVVEASLGYFINPLLSVVLGLVVLGERFGRSVWAAVALALVGVTVITVDAGRLPWISLVLASTFAIYGLVRKQSPLGAFPGLALEMAWLTPVSVALMLWWGADGSLDLGPSPWLLPGIGLMTAAPLLLFGQATRTVPLWQIGMLQFLAPSILFGLGVFAFGEEVSVGRVIGFAFIWGGLGLFAADTVARGRRAAVNARVEGRVAQR